MKIIKLKKKNEKISKNEKQYFELNNIYSYEKNYFINLFNF